MTAKGFVFFTLEDEWGLINVVVRPNVYRAQRLIWSTSHILMVEGHLERRDGHINVLALRAWKVR
jgi:error-prone DNA polymerase